MRLIRANLRATVLLVLTAIPAVAHTGDLSGGFLSGFAHPLFGPDHVVAMVAVGLWGAFLGPPPIFVLPIVFPLVMAVGGALGIVGVPLPAAEPAIAASAIVLGLMVASAARPPLWVAATIVAVFAIFHGYAHGAELPAGTDAAAYSIGFVTATGLLHLAGITLGLAVRWPAGRMGVRGTGAVIACAGLLFLWRLA
jgi:urease accessory protein